MSAFDTILNHPITIAMSWAFVQMIWQGLLLGFIYALMLIFLRKSNPQIRYKLSVLFLTLFCLIFTLNLYLNWGIKNVSLGTANTNSNALGNITLNADTSFLITVKAFVTNYLSSFFAFWILGFSVFFIRFLGAWTQVFRLKSYRNWYAGEKVEKIAMALEEKLKMKRSVTILASAIADVPMVIGHFKPVILIPAVLLSGLNEEQLKAILAHELAHVKRWDFYVNALQSFIETVFFFHPVVWWISSQIRKEREECCDDIAVQIGADPMVYAHALTKIAETQLYATPQMAMALNHKNSSGVLMGRIKRIVKGKQNTNRFKDGFLSAILIFLMLFITSFTFMAVREKSTFDKNEKAEAVQKLNESSPKETLEARTYLAIGPDRQEHQIIILKNETRELQAFIDGKEVDIAEIQKYTSVASNNLPQKKPLSVKDQKNNTLKKSDLKKVELEEELNKFEVLGAFSFDTLFNYDLKESTFEFAYKTDSLQFESAEMKNNHLQIELNIDSLNQEIFKLEKVMLKEYNDKEKERITVEKVLEGLDVDLEPFTDGDEWIFLEEDGMLIKELQEEFFDNEGRGKLEIRTKTQQAKDKALKIVKKGKDQIIIFNVK